MSRFRVRWSTGFKALRLSAVAGTNEVRVCFNAPPVATDYTVGVTITVTPDGSPRAISGTAVDKNCITYTIGGAALAEGDRIVWAYDADAIGPPPADYRSGSDETKLLEDSSLARSIPVPAASVWRTESAGTWLRADGGRWLTEN